MQEYAVTLEAVVKRFNERPVLNGVSYAVPCGQIFALLGRNGAGKTTAVNLMMGLLPADEGCMQVLGMDPAKDGARIRQRVGFVAEDAEMFGWMSIRQITKFLKPFYPEWDPELVQHLVDQFALEEEMKIRSLSKGQKTRLALILAAAHRPSLAILDDPTLGLDSISRKEFIREVIGQWQTRGVTVIYTSQLLYEVEAMADAVAILDRGRIVCHRDVEALQQQVKQLIFLRPDEPFLADVPNLLDVQNLGNQVSLIVDDVESALKFLEAHLVKPDVVDLNLEAIFEAFVAGCRSERHDPHAVMERVA